ncbi:monocarboxylate transporter 6-like [Musca vetustissima]|uniref:monocarboxylate transporter 6-like n=1 Tax=Musca vetustissima TaxID=27455 RepID=UPI002AB7483B|nr:monocarboxylate transporter 6-like [Musca vetustissima]
MSDERENLNSAKNDSITKTEQILTTSIQTKKKRKNKSDLGENFVAPDGGWGWFVSIASGANTLVTFATAQQFGIIFRGHLADLGITSSQLTTIINTQLAVSAVSGIFNGALFRRFTYRQVALLGSLLTFVGLFGCVFANTFLFYLFAYSVCYGLGRGFVISASALAINIYFKKKRRAAASYQFGVAALGPIILPYVATYLLSSVGVRYTALSFAALSLNTIPFSLVYQPVRWHVKKQDKDEESLRSKFEKSKKVNGRPHSEVNEANAKKKSPLMKIVKFFDLDLLRDLSYLNLSIGLTLINFAEINFAILTPFILSDFGFENDQIALAMSLLGLCDLIVRFLVPLITAKVELGNKVLFAIGLLGMCIGRVVLSFSITFDLMIATFLWLGISKGFRTVFWSLILPGYVPLKRLPAAVGLQRLMSGIFSMACGPIIGLMRDKTSYSTVLNFFNILCVLALFMWFLESIIRRCGKSKMLSDPKNSKN